MASRNEDQSTTPSDLTGDNMDRLNDPDRNVNNGSTSANQSTTSDIHGHASSGSGFGSDAVNSGIRQRTVASTTSGASPPSAEPLQPRPAETPQERRRRRLQRDREQLLSLINANPLACLCILVAATFVVVGVGYSLYEMHLAYKYSAIIHKLHISSLKDGYGTPSSPSSSQKARQSKVKAPPVDGSANAPEAKKMPMLDEETEMYANQLQSVLSNLKRTLNRIDPTSNSTTMIAGLVELKPTGSKEDEASATGFTTEINSEVSEDAKPNAPQGTSPNEDIYTFLTKGIKDRPEEDSLNQQTQDTSAQSKTQQSFPDYLRDLKTSLEAETQKAQDKLIDWIEKHRHQYTNEDEWNDALERKKAKEDDYNRFLDAMFYVAEALENDYSESGVGGGENNNDDDPVPLGKLLEILAKGARSNNDGEDTQTDDASGDRTAKLKKFLFGDETKSDDDWAYDMWDEDREDEENDWDKSVEEQVEPQFA